MYKKITRNDINKNNMIALGYGQCQMILGLFGEDYKVGYNAGINGWNYDLYNIHGISIVTGYRVPYKEYTNKELKQKLIALDNKVVQKKYSWAKWEEVKQELFSDFLKIFE
jgi:hypothetical protein